MRIHATQRRHTTKKTSHSLKLKKGEKIMSEWNKLIPKPSSSFLRVKCLKCGNEQLVFSNATNKVTCNVCSETLAEPSGGKAKINGEVLSVLE
jgi:small subunit ribosomal protein S27e